MLKKLLIFCLIFSCLLITAHSNAAIASDINDTSLEYNLNKGMNDFIDYISLFFEGDERFAAINHNGEDISVEFYQAYKSLFDAKSFAQLKICADNEVDYLREKPDESTSTANQISLRAVTTHNVSNYRMHITTPPAPFSQQTYGTLLESSFTENPVSGYILSAEFKHEKTNFC